MDVCPGPCTGARDGLAGAVLRSALYFQGERGEGPGLWRSDGTPAGTAPVGSPRVLDASLFVATADRIFFGLVVERQVFRGNLRLLLESDGIRESTNVVVRDPEEVAAGAGVLYTLLGDSRDGEAYVYAYRTPERPVMVFSQFVPGVVGPRGLRPYGGRLFFAGVEPASGRELWTSDGTPNGTRIVGDVSSGTGDGLPAAADGAGDEILGSGGRVFFRATDGRAGEELWAYTVE